MYWFADELWLSERIAEAEPQLKWCGLFGVVCFEEEERGRRAGTLKPSSAAPSFSLRNENAG